MKFFTKSEDSADQKNSVLLTSGLIGLIGVALISIVLMSLTTSEKSFALNQVIIKGAGSTFAFPLLDTWRVGYQKVNEYFFSLFSNTRCQI